MSNIDHDDDDEQFRKLILNSYSFEGDFFRLGTAMVDNHAVVGAQINVPLRTLNRHGLIAGATGTGKTKTLQLFAENLSDKGVPVLLLDIKGDLSGLAEFGDRNNKIIERYEKLGGEKWSSRQYPVEFLTISHEKGVRLRSTIIEFGPILLSKILSLNETQTGFISLIFKYSDDNHLPLLDLKDFIKVLQYISNEGKDEIEQIYGKIALSSTGTILRKTIELQQQNVDLFFGEPSFDIYDLIRINSSTGQGIINIIRVIDIQDKTKIFSTFMLSLLSKFYTIMPEIGDINKPKLIMFIDEAHLLFQQSVGPLLQQIETVIKLIRSKGIGIFFCTQNPTDVPSSILAQLGLKIQHALRASTAKDRKDIKKMSENFPSSEYYRVDELLTYLSIGEALVTLLNENGQPTMLAVCMMCTPRSRMNILNSEEIDALVARSQLVAKYAETIDRDSAHEILSRKINLIQLSNDKSKNEKRAGNAGKSVASKRRTYNTPNELPNYNYTEDQGHGYGHDNTAAPSSAWQRPTPNNKRKKQNRKKRSGWDQSASNDMSIPNTTILEKVLNSATPREVGRTAANAFTRGILGTLGLNTIQGTRNTSRKTIRRQNTVPNWF